ncbi:helix-turn-helix domain-containing protein [Rhizobiales bacterium 3FA27D7]|jgi:transcriptional regulator with XRE-family HTH domain|uniref:helix-turn-helix domain-containing protein n=1 Tax=Mesorhizobium sp. 2RAF21 TaxID=3232995 RepID=UPI0010F5A8FC|nr:helix-turn-helix domain-containing protein [Dolichospermum sp. ST_sed6]
MSAGARIKEARRGLSITQSDLALVLNITPSAISQWEGDLTLPDVNKLVALSIILRCSVDWILKGDERESDPANETLARIRRLEAWAWNGRPPRFLPSLDAFRRPA